MLRSTRQRAAGAQIDVRWMLNFLAFTIEGPHGIIILAVAMAFDGLSAIYALSLRASALVETSRHVKALDVTPSKYSAGTCDRFLAWDLCRHC